MANTYIMSRFPLSVIAVADSVEKLGLKAFSTLVITARGRTMKFFLKKLGFCPAPFLFNILHFK